MTPPLNSLYIYLTEQCNLNCIHCWQAAPLQTQTDPAYLTFEQCQSFLAETVEMGLQSVIFSGGEPLLNPDFKEFCRYLTRHQVQLTLETNGMLIPLKTNLKTLLEHGVYCAVSLDGVLEQTHNAYRRNSGAFTRTLAGLQLLQEAQLPFQVIMAISKYNYSELVPLLDFIAQRFSCCNAFKINVVGSIGRAEEMAQNGMLFAATELPQLTRDVAPLIGRYPFQISLHIDPAFFSLDHLRMNFSCGGHCGYQHSMSILADGTISICSLGKQINGTTFGHVSAVRIKELWAGHPFLVAIRSQEVYQKLKGICGNCIFRKNCLGGCRAQALRVYGDFYAPHPFCQAYYEAGQFPPSRFIRPQDHDAARYEPSRILEQ